jgi:hypothetical protein
MTIAWYDPTNHHVSTDKNDPLFTPLGQLWPLVVQREWVGLTDAEKDGKRVLENGLLFNAAEVQAWELGIDYAESKLKERNA